MPRCPRLDIPGLPRHICIRAVDGMPCLTTDMDRNVFLKYLREAMDGQDFHLHAFVLMSNHVHLLATGLGRGAVSKVMHSVGLRYAGYFNRQADRTGPLFQGRYWASLIDSQSYFFQAMRYIELNPVRAGMVDGPERFPWSSYAHNTGKDKRVEITLHEEFLHLGGSSADRSSVWADYVSEGIAQRELERIRKRFRKSRPYGSDDFEKRMVFKRDGSSEPVPGTVPRNRPLYLSGQCSDLVLAGSTNSSAPNIQYMRRVPRGGRPVSTIDLRFPRMKSPPFIISFSVPVPAGMSSTVRVTSTPPSTFLRS